MIKMNKHVCLVCGFDGLEEPPYYEDYAGSNEICACCGFEYGVDDFDCDEFSHESLNDKEIVEKSHLLWRAKWIDKNYILFNPKYFSNELKDGNHMKPEQARMQLKNLSI